MIIPTRLFRFSYAHFISGETEAQRGQVRLALRGFQPDDLVIIIDSGF
jgi:hypothetical protein